MSSTEVHKKMYITKYALTSGIILADMRSEPSDYEGVILWRLLDVHDLRFFREGHDCFATKEEALAAAEAKCKRQIASLKRQLRRLEGFKPEIKEGV